MVEWPNVLLAVLGFLVIGGVVICRGVCFSAREQRLHTTTQHRCPCVKEVFASLKQSTPSEFKMKSAQEASVVSPHCGQVEAWPSATVNDSPLGAKDLSQDAEESISGSARISSSARTDGRQLTTEGKRGPRPRGWLDAWADVRAREASIIAPSTQPSSITKSQFGPCTDNQRMHYHPPAPGQEAPTLIMEAEDDLQAFPNVPNVPNADNAQELPSSALERPVGIKTYGRAPSRCRPTPKDVESNARSGKTSNSIGGESFRTLSSADELGDGWVKIVNPDTGLTYCFLRKGGQHIQSKWECTPIQSPQSKTCISPDLSQKNKLRTSLPNRVKKSRHKPHPPATICQTVPHKQRLGETEKGDVLRQLRGSQNQDEALRRKTFKAMTLRWHPDKHPDNAELATEVFQFLQQQREWYLIDTEVVV